MDAYGSSDMLRHLAFHFPNYPDYAYFILANLQKKEMKLYKQITCIALFCSAAFSLGAQSTHMELSLEDALSAARQNEIQIKNARLDLQASRYQKQEAFAEYFPRVSAMAIGFYAVNPMLEIGITDILGDNDFAWGVQQKAEELAGAYGFNTTYTAFKSGYSTSLSDAASVCGRQNCQRQ